MPGRFWEWKTLQARVDSLQKFLANLVENQSAVEENPQKDGNETEDIQDSVVVTEEEPSEKEENEQ